MRAAIIVRPEIPENTGFIARLCENFGFSLRLVQPGFNLEKARKTASGAQQTLRDAQIYSSVEEAVDDLEYVAGTKPGKGMETRNLQPRQNTSIMIGPESSGLTNQDLELCDTVTHIETRQYNSINQSHAAAIIMHQLQETRKPGINKDQKQYLEKLLGDSKIHELILRTNPPQDEISRIIGELEQFKERELKR